MDNLRFGIAVAPVAWLKNQAGCHGYPRVILGVQFALESVSSFKWNPCPVSNGIRVQFQPETVSSFDQNTHEFDEKAGHIGSRWKINEQEAAIVKEIYARREYGDSMHQIAAWLNSCGVLCRRKARKADGGHWRASRVLSILQNHIYRGVFVWHGSTTYAKKMKDQGLPVDKVEFARPELRLVSDETWYRCNTRLVNRTNYGGGKHHFAGLANCGFCGSVLALSAVRKCRSLYCAICTEAKSTTGQERFTGTVAVRGVEQLFTFALEYFISEPFLDAFRNALRLRLTGDQRAEVDACETRLKKLRSAQERLSHLLANITDEDPVLHERYLEIRQKVVDTEKQFISMQESAKIVDANALDAQLKIDPRQLIPQLFDEALPPQRLRVVLGRLFPSIVFERKEHRVASVFRIRFSPGAALAQASGTESISFEELEARFLLTYQQHTLAKPAHWTVKVLNDLSSPTSMKNTPGVPVDVT